MNTNIDWSLWCMNAGIFISGLITMVLIYLGGRRDERVKSLRKIIELRHTCYKQQEMINALTTERDVYRNGYESMSKRVQRMDAPATSLAARDVPPSNGRAKGSNV